MKTTHRILQSKEQIFLSLKQQYKRTISPKIKKLLELRQSDFIEVFSVWVTEYGDLNGDEWQDKDTLTNVLTENGHRVLKSPYIYVDIGFGIYDNSVTHQRICEELGVSDLYGENFYRLETNNLNDYIKYIEDVIKLLDEEFTDDETINETETMETNAQKILPTIENWLIEGFKSLLYPNNFSAPREVIELVKLCYSFYDSIEEFVAVFFQCKTTQNFIEQVFVEKMRGIVCFEYYNKTSHEFTELSECCKYIRQMDAQSLINEYYRLKSIKMYRWTASSDDGAYNDESDKYFKTEEECYNNMRNNALNKMKWNTEYIADLDGMADHEYIGYNVKFFKNKIVHDSYSGVYTYQIEVV